MGGRAVAKLLCEKFHDHGSAAPATCTRTAGTLDVGGRPGSACDRVLHIARANHEAVTNEHMNLRVRAESIWALRELRRS